MENSDVNKRESRPSTRLNSDDVRRERALSLKRSRAGHLGSLTKAQNEIETLLLDEDSSNVTLVKEKFDHYETLWKNFVLSHNKFMDVAEPEEKADNAERFDNLAKQRVSLSTSVEKFICNAATKLNEWVMEDLQKLTGPRHHGFVSSRSHRSSRRSSSTYSSKAQACRLEAEKAQLALVFAEQERQRRIEEEMKMLELKRKQRELARMREAEEEELKAILSGIPKDRGRPQTRRSKKSSRHYGLGGQTYRRNGRGIIRQRVIIGGVDTIRVCTSLVWQHY